MVVSQLYKIAVVAFHQCFKILPVFVQLLTSEINMLSISTYTSQKLLLNDQSYIWGQDRGDGKMHRIKLNKNAPFWLFKRTLMQCTRIGKNWVIHHIKSLISLFCGRSQEYITHISCLPFFWFTNENEGWTKALILKTTTTITFSGAYVVNRPSI